MKRVLSRMLVASGLLLGASALSTASFAAEGAAGPAKPDAAKGGQLFDQETPRAASSPVPPVTARRATAPSR